MSHKATAWAFAQQLPALQKLVLIVLADRHNGDTGRCDVSFSSLVITCGLSEKETDEILTQLSTEGLILWSEDGAVLVGVE